MKEYLYSPLLVTMQYKDGRSHYDDVNYWCDELEPYEVLEHAEKIQAAIAKEQLRGGEVCNLMNYFHCDSKHKAVEQSVKDKISFAFPTVAVFDGELYGVMEMEIKEPLTEAEMSAIKDYCTGQYSDGLGEGIEQREIKTSEGDLYVSLWNTNNYFIDTEQEFQQRLGHGIDFTEGQDMIQEMG